MYYIVIRMTCNCQLARFAFRFSSEAVLGYISAIENEREVEYGHKNS
jgi:hypothetical protein